MFGDHVIPILPPSSLAISYALTSETCAGGMPSFSPPAVTTGPKIVAFSGSDCPF